RRCRPWLCASTRWLPCALLTLHGAGREARDDSLLEDENQDDNRDRDDDRRGGDEAGWRDELRRPGEEAQYGRDGLRTVDLERRHATGRRGERGREDEVVPGGEEGDDRGREDTRHRQGQYDLAKRLPAGGTVDLRRLLHLPRDLPEERRQRPDRDRQGERQVRDDQPEPGVVEPD